MRLPVTLQPKTSLSLSSALGAAHALVFLGLVATGLPLAMLLLAGLLLSASLAMQLHAQRHPTWAAFTLLPDGRLELERMDGQRGEAELLAGSTAFPWLVVLLLVVDGHRLALVLPTDSLVGDGHRILRLWLRWRGRTAGKRATGSD